MKNFVCALAGGLMLATSLGAMAGDDMKMNMEMKMKMMDTNSDGMISKDEYMAYHEKMWMKMKKNSMGMVDGKMMMDDHKMDSMKPDGMTKEK
jgi:hypothetical protein